MRWRVAVVAALIAGCGNGDTGPPATSGQGCADVIDATAQRQDDGAWTISATVSSADTGWEKYADAWEVRALDGAVLGVRELAHPHVDEQPFTRSLRGVAIPEGTTEVVVAARDSVAGWCGEEFTLTL